MKIERSKILIEVLRNSKIVLSDICDRDISVTEHFVDLGASSIDRAVIADDTLASLNVHISLEELIDSPTISDLADRIFQGLNC